MSTRCSARSVACSRRPRPRDRRATLRSSAWTRRDPAAIPASTVGRASGADRIAEIARREVRTRCRRSVRRREPCVICWRGGDDRLAHIMLFGPECVTRALASSNGDTCFATSSARAGWVSCTARTICGRVARLRSSSCTRSPGAPGSLASTCSPGGAPAHASITPTSSRCSMSGRVLVSRSW